MTHTLTQADIDKARTFADEARTRSAQLASEGDIEQAREVYNQEFLPRKRGVNLILRNQSEERRKEMII